MAKISCFSALLGGRRKRSKVSKKDAYGKKAHGNDCPKVKPVEFMDMADTVDVSKGGDNAPARDTGAVVQATTERTRRGRDENDDKASVKMESSYVDLVAGEGSSGYTYTSDDAGKNGISAEPDAGECASVGRMAPTASPKLKRSCSNIETARSAPIGFDLPAKSRSYDDLKKTLSSGRLTTTPGGAPDASPTASVRTSCSADCVMLKKRSSRQVLPSRSRKLWWRLFLWSHRNLHRPGGMPTLPSADIDGEPHQHDGYTSDTLDAVTAATADAKNKELAVEEEPIPNQWVAFAAEASPGDRVSAWVRSLGNGSFHVAGEDDAPEHDGGAARPCCLEVGESSAAGRSHAQAKRRTADEAVVASSIVRTLNASSAVAHISGMGLRAPLERRNFTGITQDFHRNQFNFAGISQETGKFPPFQRGPQGRPDDLRLLEPPSSQSIRQLHCSHLPWIVATRPAHSRSVEEQDRRHRGAPGADEAARAQPQLQPHLTDRTWAFELHGDQGAVPRREQDQRRGGAAPAAEAGGAGPELQPGHDGQVPGPAGGQLPLPAGAQPAGQPGAGQRRRRHAPQGGDGPPPAARVPEPAARAAAARAGGGQGQRRAGGARRRRRRVGGAPEAGVAAGEPEPRAGAGEEPGQGRERRPPGKQEQVQEQASELDPREEVMQMQPPM